jgi:4-hydroxy-tetrahydrodipicolinate synthase
MELRGGCGTALVTPFRHDGAVDETGLRELVAWQVESGIDFLVPCGTTGETPTLSRKEWLRVISLTVEVAGGRVPIVAGATSNSTREAIEKARTAAALAGVDAILTASPYYNKPTQEGQFQHFRAIAQSVRKPLILYNVPGRTAANLEPATLARLASVRNIIGVKEASGNISQIVDVFNAVPESFLVFSGDDAVTLPVISLGGAGIISVVSNEIPREMAEMTRAALANDWQTARRLHRHYAALMQANFIESNPIPVKAVLAMMGRIREVYRLPLVRMKEENRARLHKIASDAGLPLRAGSEQGPARARELRKLSYPQEVEPGESRGAAAVPANYASAVPEEDLADAASPAQASQQAIPPFSGGEPAGGEPAGGGNEAQPVSQLAPESVEAAEPAAVPQPLPHQQPVEGAGQEELAPPQPLPPQQAPEPAAPPSFFVLESWQSGPRKTILHRSTCGSCKNGSSGGAEASNSRWHGPYASLQQAREASRSLPGVLIRSECKCVSRNS